MPQDFRQLCFIVELTKEESEFAERLLHALDAVSDAADARDDYAAIYAEPEIVPADLYEHVRRIDPMGFSPNIVVEYVNDGLWVLGGELGLANPTIVAAWLREILRKFGRPEAVGFEWSDDCTSPHTKAFGGGACVVTKERTSWLDTREWMNEQLKNLGQKHV
jgi:hypothetical protein